MKKIQSALFFCATALALVQAVKAQVTFSISPATAVSDTYTGDLTLTITGLTNGETVTLQAFLDVKANGVIDGSDLLLGQGPLTDGRALAFDGVTNLNVPGDLDAIPGQITARLPFQTAFSYRDVGQNFIGNYLFRVSSPTGRFAAITNSAAVTNANFGQSFTGAVQSNGTNVPYALVFLLILPAGDGMAATVTDSNGNYTLEAPPGDYSVIAAKSNFVMNGSTAPSAILNSGATITTNLTLIAATQTISGSVVDSTTRNGLGGILLTVHDKTSGLEAGAFTDSNGNFTVPAIASSQWKMKCSIMGLAAANHLGLQNSPVVDTTVGSVSGLTIAVPWGLAIIYGTVKDDQAHPIPGLRLWFNSSNTYETATVTDAKGNYQACAFGGDWNASFDTDVPLLANYLWPTNGVGVSATNYRATELDFVLPIIGEPVLSQPVNLPGGRFGFNLAGLIGTNYVVQACTDLSMSNWFTVLSTNLTASPAFIRDDQATNGSRFYRAVKL
jgi:hypothetical protein